MIITCYYYDEKGDSDRNTVTTVIIIDLKLIIARRQERIWVQLASLRFAHRITGKTEVSLKTKSYVL